MKLSLAFLFLSVFGLCLAAGQSTPGSTAEANSATTTQERISNGPVAEYVTDSKCTIGWSTSLSGTMMVRYGTDRARLTETKEAVESKDGGNYHVQLDGLTPNTRYYFRIVNGSEAISGVGTFQTVAKGDSPVRSKAVIPQ